MKGFALMKTNYIRQPSKGSCPVHFKPQYTNNLRTSV